MVSSWFLGPALRLSSVELSLLLAPSLLMNYLLHSACYLRTTCFLSASFLRHFSLTVAELRAPLSRFLEGALYKYPEWMNEPRAIRLHNYILSSLQRPRVLNKSAMPKNIYGAGNWATGREGLAIGSTQGPTKWELKFSSSQTENNLWLPNIILQYFTLGIILR